MIRLMRDKFGPIIVGLIIGGIAFVFVFSIDFTPRSGMSGSYAGTVNGEVIGLGEFNRELNRRMEFFGNMKFSKEQLRQFRIRQGVFHELARRKLMIQEAKRQGMLLSDIAVRESIKRYKAFQENGKFDKERYFQILAANRFTPTSFERDIRNSLIMQKWQERFQNMAQVSEREIEREFTNSGDRRDIKYVKLTQESGRKALKITEKEITDYLKDEKKLNLVKSRYEVRKESPEYKGKSFDKVKRRIARNLIASDKAGEVSKINDRMAQKIAKVLTRSKSSDKTVNALLKAVDVKVQTTGWFSRKSRMIPGVGEVKALWEDAFSGKGGLKKKAKIYQAGGSVIVAILQAEETAKLKTLNDKKRAEIAERLSQEKSRELFDGWLKDLTEKAEIVPNPSVIEET